MPSYRLQRDNDVDLVFDGEHLAHVSSESQTLRWTEIDIWKSDSGKYITRIVGKTRVSREQERLTLRVVDTPQELIVALRRKDTVEYLTHLALDALEIAAEHDQTIADSLVERI